MLSLFVIIGVVVTFIGFNLENRTTVSFGFYVLTDLPVFIVIFSSFLLGSLIMLPFTFRRKSPKKIEKK